MSDQRKQAGNRAAACVSVFALGFLVIAGAAVAFHVYVLGRFDSKFGRHGMFALGLVAFSVVDFVVSVLCAAVAFGFRRRLAEAESFWRVLAVFAGLGGLCAIVAIVIHQIVT
jgi:MFS family permease